MVREVRDAQMVRLSTSRPRWSVPNTCAAPGGTSRWSKFAMSGAYGATAGAVTAVAVRRASASPPSRARRFRTNRWAMRRRRELSLVTAIRTRASVVADARIEERVRDVGEQVAHDDQRRAEHGHRHHDGVVAAQRPLEGEPADAGNREDRLHDHRSAEQRRYQE